MEVSNGERGRTTVTQQQLKKEKNYGEMNVLLKIMFTYTYLLKIKIKFTNETIILHPVMVLTKCHFFRGPSAVIE